MYKTGAVLSLEQSEYIITDENSTLSVVVTMNEVTSQDVIVEVTITDETTTGTYVCMFLNA